MMEYEYTKTYFNIMYYLANKKGNIEEVKYALDNGADPNSIPSDDDIRVFFITMLFLGIMEKNIEKVKYALDNRANPNWSYQYDDIHKIFHMEKDMIDLIYKNMGRVYDIPLLYLAIDFASPEIVKLLIKYGANTNDFSMYFGFPFNYSQDKLKEELKEIIPLPERKKRLLN